MSVLGVLMRYKISYSFPLLDQKHVLHSHSHFAFTGWVTQALLLLLVYFLQQHRPDAFKKYQSLLWLNLICAYGMLVSFILQGYALFSISFSTLSILVAYAFAVVYWKDLNRIKAAGAASIWLKASLLFNVLSSLGAFSLAAFMALKMVDQKIYLGSVYYFLHFQYNGWFFFACMGLFVYAAKLHAQNGMRRVFWLLAGACIPAYLLSILWAAVHPMLYAAVLISSLMQTAGWALFVYQLFKNKEMLRSTFSRAAGLLLKLAAVACTIKILLQQGSVIPSLSKLAFGFRPIVIGYLHLVLLGVITLFLLAYMLWQKMIPTNKASSVGLSIFVTGIFLNELLLMTQGLTAITGIMLPYLNEALLGAAITLFFGLLVLYVAVHKHRVAPPQLHAASFPGK
ncbi:MAG: hypothetical protein EOO03_12450 [Chitinophagaceae bacterium]|nr:MAG: hypothetical protein EOO03_12450 [Chitinophagaceae bacterium]